MCEIPAIHIQDTYQVYMYQDTIRVRTTYYCCRYQACASYQEETIPKYTKYVANQLVWRPRYDWCEEKSVKMGAEHQPNEAWGVKISTTLERFKFPYVV